MLCQGHVRSGSGQTTNAIIIIIIIIIIVSLIPVMAVPVSERASERAGFGDP